ncbi:MAG: RNA methyltransferase [Firmicutes bacterium]|nr:RNA methyltransferase [Bacillota bacterium]
MDEKLTIKQIKSLKTKKGRDALNLFIVEGEKFVAEIPTENFKIVAFVCTESKLYLVDKFLEREIQIIKVSDKYFSGISDTVTPQGIMAVCEKRTFALSNILGNLQNGQKNPKPNFLLLLENIADPGNLGTLIRTAAAAKVQAVILSTGCCDIYNPKVIRAAAGAFFRVPIVDNADFTEVIPQLQQNGTNIVATSLQAKNLAYDINLCESCGILIGNEANGLSQQVLNLANLSVKLPMFNNVESLNAATAGGILLYEVVRQRLEK